MAAHRMTHDELAREERRYLQVFFWLALLTVFELGVIYLPIPRLAIGAMLVILALTKAALVAGYYMHLIHEVRTLSYIAVTPLILCIFLLLLLMPDLRALTRLLEHKPIVPEATAPH